jgi:hypothetical protein
VSHPPKAVIHINFIPEILRFEPRRIWTALGRAEALGKITGAERLALESSLGRTAIHMATRDYVMTVAVTELKNALQRLGQLIPEPWKIPEIDRDGNAYRVVNRKEIMIERDHVLLAVDSFLFEFRAYLELLAKFVYGILKGIKQAPSGKQRLSSGISVQVTDRKNKLRSHDFLLYFCDQLGVPIDWFDFLALHRNFFTHAGAPYIAIEDRLVRPPEFDFIIMRENIHQFQAANPKDYFRLSEFKKVVDGLSRLAGAAQRHIVELLEK